MKRRTHNGFTMIELIVFILVIGIIASGLFVGMNQSLSYGNEPRTITKASFLANARMQVILMNRTFNGYASLSDPCTTTPALAICTPLSSYASTNGFSVATPSISGANPKTITITVTGSGNATISSRIYDYAGN